ncbi:MAG: hypothetical protein O3A00_21040 [Planctomycetota bacterium]|nr:hypothetical protein [Planctomycetota bacterium]
MNALCTTRLLVGSVFCLAITQSLHSDTKPAVSRDAATRPVGVVDIGSRRELFVDGSLIESLDGARRRLHHPIPREIAIVHDAPWEGAGSGYHTVIHDGDVYRMYHRGSALGVKDGRLKAGKQVYCYAESRDGIHWKKPNLGLFAYNGSKDNNIVWDGVGVHNFSPFLDQRADCPADARFKALAGTAQEGGLFAFKSADGIHWSLMQKDPVVTKGAFDSQNLAFWDPTAGKYRAYFRTFTKGVTTGKVWKPAGYRAIRTASSADFLAWNEEADLTYEDSPVEHLYTNQIGPYFRAPHILIGFPTRYVERGWSASMRALPQLEDRQQRAAANLRYGTALTEGLLMASRNGVHFERWNEAFLRPGPQRPETWLYGHQYIAWHAVETESSLPGAPREMSLYASEGSWTGTSNAMRRYTLRLDGFVSVNGPWKGGELITKPLQFEGRRLSLNFATSAAGSVRVEIQGVDGKPISGFALKDCPETFGDTLDRTVEWNENSNVEKLSGKPVRLRFVLKDADLYSFQFTNDAPK